MKIEVMKRKSKMFQIWILSIVIICIGIIGGIIWHTTGPSKQNKAEIIINKIETFRMQNGRLPTQLEDIDIEQKLEGPVFYERKDASHYIVWYGTKLGSSMVYNSKDASWYEAN